MEQEKKKLNLKIIIPIVVVAIIVVIMIALKLTSNKEIELTMDNYSDYLDITINSTGYGTRLEAKDWGQIMAIVNKSNSVKWSFYPKIYMGVEVKGVSNNFNYENVIVSVEFEGSYYAFRFNQESKQEYIKEIVRVDNCNIAGTGENSITYQIPNNGYTQDFVKGRVIGISGKVIPVN